MAWKENWWTTTFLYFLLHNSWEESAHSTSPGRCWPAGREHKQSKSARYLTAVLLCIHLYHTPYAKPQSRWGGDPFKKRLSKPQRKSIFPFSVPALISYSHASFPLPHPILRPHLLSNWCKIVRSSVLGQLQEVIFQVTCKETQYLCALKKKKESCNHVIWGKNLSLMFKNNYLCLNISS